MIKKKNFSPEQKIAIIKKQLLEKVPVSDLENKLVKKYEVFSSSDGYLLQICTVATIFTPGRKGDA